LARLDLTLDSVCAVTLRLGDGRRLTGEVGKMWGKCGENVGKMWGKCGENVGKMWGKGSETDGKIWKMWERLGKMMGTC